MKPKELKRAIGEIAKVAEISSRWLSTNFVFIALSDQVYRLSGETFVTLRYHRFPTK